MEKIDLKKEWKHLYRPSSKKFQIVDVPPLNFIMADGEGMPDDSPSFQHAVEALYNVAYHMKFSSKQGGGPDWVVMPLEGLWWVHGGKDFVSASREEWRWTLMIAQPDEAAEDLFQAAVRETAAEKDLPALPSLRWERYHEGLAAQIMHIGPNDQEVGTLKKMHAFLTEQGYEMHGKHHEIYMSDPRRVPPERLKTVLRHPIRKV